MCQWGHFRKNEKIPTADRIQLYRLGNSSFLPSAYRGCAAAIAFSCFFGLSFPLAIRYFRSFDVNEMLRTLSDYLDKEPRETNLDMLRRAVDFIDVLNQFYGDHPAEAGACLAGQPEMLEFIESQLRSDSNAMLVSVVGNAYFKKGGNDSRNREQEELAPLYKWYCKSGITVTLGDGSSIRISLFPDSLSKVNEN